jgi:hypothetical protein
LKLWPIALFNKYMLSWTENAVIIPPTSRIKR